MTVTVHKYPLQVTIPDYKTTYWCKTFRLPDSLINNTHYVTAVSNNKYVLFVLYMYRVLM